jgi:hypothetical protein
LNAKIFEMKIGAKFCLSVFALLAIGTAVGISIAVMVTGWQTNVIKVWNVTSTQIQENVKQSIDKHLAVVEFAAGGVFFFSPNTPTECPKNSIFPITLENTEESNSVW